MIQDIEGFYQRVTGDPALMASLIKGAQSPAEVLTRASSKANELGYQFSVAEATAWSDQQIAARANGELSDVQLAAVAGGKEPIKTGDNPGIYGIGVAINAVTDGLNTAAAAIGNNVVEPINKWFLSW